MEFTKLVESDGGNFVPRIIIGINFSMLVIAEWVWSRQKQMQIHDGKETAANFVVLLGNQISKALFLSWQLWILTSVADYKILSWEPGILSFIGTFFLVNFQESAII